MIKGIYPQRVWETLGKRVAEKQRRMGITEKRQVVHFFGEFSTKFSTGFSPRITRDLSKYPPALLQLQLYLIYST